jgi:hypothetical protein
MRTIFLFTCLVLVLQAGAQDQKKGTKPSFTSINSIGMLEGQGGTSFSIQSINGVRLNSFSVGVGLGIDYYLVRSLPLFVDVRKDLFSKKQSPFIYLNAGTNFPWEKQAESWQQVDLKGGLFYEGGVGYSWPLKSASFVLSLGYSYKAFKEKISYDVFCIDGNCPEINETRAYQLRRLSIRAGFRF